LIEELAKKIDSGVVFADKDYLEQIPLGWYETEILKNVEGETNLFREFVIIYQDKYEKFKRFIEGIRETLSPEWEDENLSDEWMKPFSDNWIRQYFYANDENDDFNRTLDLDLINIARHIAQTGGAPKFFSFEERDKHDLGKLAFAVVQNGMNPLAIDELLSKEFNEPDKLWRVFYRTYQRFQSAFDAEVRRAVNKIKYNSEDFLSIPKGDEHDLIDRELTEKEKKQVFARDNFTCLCCGKFRMKGKRIKLEVDHILPFKFGGQATIDNSQTLCT
jgi:hypothetical protein